MIERLPALVNGNESLVRRGRFLNVDFMIEVGDIRYFIAVRSGRIESVERSSLLVKSWRFAIRASEEAWKKFWEPVPGPGYQDIFAMIKFGEARMEGDLQPLMANLRYIKEVLALPRTCTGGC